MKYIAYLLIGIILFSSYVVAQDFVSSIPLKHDPKWASKMNVAQIQEVSVRQEDATIQAKGFIVENILGAVISKVSIINNNTSMIITKVDIPPTKLTGAKKRSDLDVVDTKLGVVASYMEISNAWMIRSIERSIGGKLKGSEYMEVSRLLPEKLLVCGISGYTEGGKLIANAITAAYAEARSNVAKQVTEEIVACNEKVNKFILEEQTRLNVLQKTTLVGCEILKINIDFTAKKVTMKLRIPKHMCIYSLSQNLKKLGLELSDEDYSLFEGIEDDDEIFIAEGIGLMAK